MSVDKGESERAALKIGTSTAGNPKAAKSGVLLLSIAFVAVITYLPAINNFFISDDFGMFGYLKSFRQSPTSILEVPSELFRITSYLYLFVCTKIFGMNS